MTFYIHPYVRRPGLISASGEIIEQKLVKGNVQGFIFWGEPLQTEFESAWYHVPSRQNTERAILLNTPSPPRTMVNIVYKTDTPWVEKIVEGLGFFQRMERFEGTNQKEILKAIAEMPEK